LAHILPNLNTLNFAGQIDDVRIYNYALSAPR